MSLKCESTFAQTPLPSSSLNPTPETTIARVQHLHSRLTHLHALLTQPQKLHLRRFEFLQLKNVSHTIEQRVQTLFFEAHIPINWTLKVEYTCSLSKKTDVSITFINYNVKERAKTLLKEFFKMNYNNIIYVDH